MDRSSLWTRADERNVDLRFERCRKLVLRLLCRFLQTLQRHPVPAHVDAVLHLELVGQRVDASLIEVFAAQVRVTAGCLDAEDATFDLEDGDVERPAT